MNDVRRCWCGRSISDPAEVFCAEHDDATALRAAIARHPADKARTTTLGDAS